MLPSLGVFLVFPAILYAAVVPSPASISQNRFNVSGFSGQPAYCVNTGKSPRWNGRIIHADCVQALTYLKLHAADYSNLVYAFYSDQGGFEPPRPGDKAQNWRLPTTTIHQSCQIQVRMLRDFATAEIPRKGGYVRPVLFPPAAISTWHSILKELEKVLLCAKYGEPGWASDGIKVYKAPKEDPMPIGVFMWGKTSAIAQEYLEPNFNKLEILDVASRTA